MVSTKALTSAGKAGRLIGCQVKFYIIAGVPQFERTRQINRHIQVQLFAGGDG